LKFILSIENSLQKYKKEKRGLLKRALFILTPKSLPVGRQGFRGTY
jgi:hypothetical protein